MGYLLFSLVLLAAYHESNYIFTYTNNFKVNVINKLLRLFLEMFQVQPANTKHGRLPKFHC